MATVYGWPSSAGRPATIAVNQGGCSVKNVLRRSVITTFAVGTAVTLTAAPAYAGGDSHTPPPTGGKHPVITSDSGYYPGNFNDVGSVQHTNECGALISITITEDAIEERDIAYSNGDTEEDFKGPYKLMFGSDKNSITVTLDASSPYTEVDYAKPSGALSLNLTVPSTVYAFTAGENAAYKKEGLPPIFYYARGTFAEYDRTKTKTYILQTPKKVTSVCGLLGLPDKYGSGFVNTP